MLSTATAISKFSSAASISSSAFTKLPAAFPAEEKFGLTAQVRRAAVSIPSNIAEGWGRSSTKDYVRLLEIARSSLLEGETQIIVACRLGFINSPTQDKALQETAVESRMLLALMRPRQR